MPRLAPQQLLAAIAALVTTVVALGAVLATLRAGPEAEQDMRTVALLMGAAVVAAAVPLVAGSLPAFRPLAAAAALLLVVAGGLLAWFGAYLLLLPAVLLVVALVLPASAWPRRS